MKRKSIAAARSLWSLMWPGEVPSSEREEFLERLLENLPGMAYRCRNDPDWTMGFVSQGCRELTGYAPEELVGSQVVTYADLIHADDRDRVWSTVQESLGQHARFRVTYRIRRADGAERWVWEQGVGVPSPGGEIETIEGFITDITDRRELADQVTRHETRYRAVVEQALAGIYVIQGGRFSYVNPRFAEIFGYTPEEVTDLWSITALVHPDDRDLVMENLRLRTEGDVSVLRYQFRGRRKDGSECDVEVQGRAVEWDGGRAVIGVLLDVTERERALRFYHGAKKMKALGELATGVAHDFNNHLTVIKSTAQLVAEGAEEGSTQAADMAEIIAATGRATALCRQLMAFGRARSTTPSALPLAATVEEMLPMLRRLLGSGIEVEVRMDEGLPSVRLDSAGIEEVLMNLALNARDAMPGGGTLIIRAHRGSDLATPPPPPSADVDHVVLEVTDTGVGMPKHVCQRVFEPYFTTKGDEGTGLGLANVWRIVTDASGTVEVESEVGTGTTFRIWLQALPS